ncbi:MAG: hypothetical protein ABEJ75_04000 [Candidatus Nanohaloarchaea archaeon]
MTRYTLDDLDGTYSVAEDILREAKNIAEDFRSIGMAGFRDGYEIGDQIYREVEEVLEENGEITDTRLEELGAEIFRENGWPSPRYLEQLQNPVELKSRRS